MAGEVLAAFFHFDQDDRLPDKVGEPGGGAIFFNTVFEGCAGLFVSATGEAPEEAVEEDLGLALLIALECFGIGNKIFKLLFSVLVHECGECTEGGRTAVGLWSGGWGTFVLALRMAPVPAANLHETLAHEWVLA